MLYKTRAIVLSFIKYSESSIIVKLFTEELGLQTYIVNSVRSKTSKGKIALYQPLNLLELVVYFKENREINRISETKILEVFKSIPFDIRKSTIALFISEILGKTIKEESANPPLFHFLYDSVFELENSGFLPNYPVQFLLKFARIQGLLPETAEEIYLQVYNKTLHFENEIRILNILMELPYQNNEQIPLNMRRTMLEVVLRFYTLHISGFGEVKSLSVLREIFD
jgi:DNA repair protein RecO (recombination protein O)